MKVLIAPDKFKGTLPAPEAARVMAEGWRKARPGDDVELMPISDGGDGFGDTVSGLLGAKARSTKTIDAAHRNCETTWWYDPTTKTAIIESAQVIGLAMLPPGKFHPFELDTFGLGTVLEAARDAGAENFLIGVGGSATNDAGFGLAHALGWKFVDGQGHPVTRWTELYRVKSVHAPEVSLPGKVVVAVDVQNPLLGENGATRIYGPQKGIRPEDFDLAERCLGQLAKIMAVEFKNDFSQRPGAGAAGGLGFGLMAFLDAEARPGFELFAGQAELLRRLQGTDLVITGEGAIDGSTLMGKGVGQLAKLCRDQKIPCIGLAGQVRQEQQVQELFQVLRGLTDFLAPEVAKTNASVQLASLTERVAADWKKT